VAGGLVLSEVNPNAGERGVVDFREWAHVFAYYGKYGVVYSIAFTN
jgi:hypothetical protein